MVKTPVALFVFNRPDVTTKVFESIRQARPAELFVIADGPRADRPDEDRLCAETRAITEQVDWPCTVRRAYAATNMGCTMRLVSGLNWVFEQVEACIILEDDCLPHPSFYGFCEGLLGRYKDVEQVMMISGANLTMGRWRSRYSYSFSHLGCMWGWATWRRAWRHYDLSLARWPELRETPWLDEVLGHPEAVRVWRGHFDHFHAVQERASTWDAQWEYSLWAQRGLAVIPSVNLISNLGFGPNATHTTGSHPFANLPTQSLRGLLFHPPEPRRDEALHAALIGTKFAPHATAARPGLLSERSLLRRIARRILPEQLRRQAVKLWGMVRTGGAAGLLVGGDTALLGETLPLLLGAAL